jgi:hypothetical protein
MKKDIITHTLQALIAVALLFVGYQLRAINTSLHNLQTISVVNGGHNLPRPPSLMDDDTFKIEVGVMPEPVQVEIER